MKEGPILFKGEMVLGVLDDRKTQTRRVIKHIPEGNWVFDHKDYPYCIYQIPITLIVLI